MSKIKCVFTPNYHYTFNTDTGFLRRWGKTRWDDPQFSPEGPEIIDMEISTICNKACKCCYKSNTCSGTNMSLDTFKSIMDKLPQNVCQIAFGVGDLAQPTIYLRKKR